MKKLALFFAVIGGLILSDVPKANADLLITPLRAVFQDRERSTIVTLINTGEKTNTYRIGWKLLKMKEGIGGYEPVETFTDRDGNNLAADKMVRFSPRQVTIEPQGRQRIRLSLRRPGDLADGEYRAHLTFTRLAKIPQNTGADENIRGQQMMLHANIAFSIPVIVRHGNIQAVATLENPEFMVPPPNAGDQRTLLMVDIKSASKFSSYGRLRAYWKKPNGKEEQVGILNNIAVFPEVDVRRVGIPMEKPRLNGGSVRIVYEGMDEYSGVIFDEEIFEVR
jgi:P pilus assembly chaperone PapD